MTGLGKQHTFLNLTNSPLKLLRSSRHSARIASIYSQARRPRFSHGTPIASEASANHPTPTPSAKRPPQRKTVQGGDLLSKDDRVVLRHQADSGRQPNSIRQSGGEAEGHERV